MAAAVLFTCLFPVATAEAKAPDKRYGHFEFDYPDDETCSFPMHVYYVIDTMFIDYFD